jgi:hypothetical protein
LDYGGDKPKTATNQLCRFNTVQLTMFDFPESGDVGYEQKVDRQFFK